MDTQTLCRTSIGVALRLALTAACSCAVATNVDPKPSPYVLEGTEVQAVHAQTLNRDDELYVSLPAVFPAITTRGLLWALPAR